MNYENIYSRLMQKRIDDPIDKANIICECHHIKPRSLGGDN